MGLQIHSNFLSALNFLYGPHMGHRHSESMFQPGVWQTLMILLWAEWQKVWESFNRFNSMPWDIDECLMPIWSLAYWVSLLGMCHRVLLGLFRLEFLSTTWIKAQAEQAKLNVIEKKTQSTIFRLENQLHKYEIN